MIIFFKEMRSLLREHQPPKNRGRRRFGGAALLFLSLLLLTGGVPRNAWPQGYFDIYGVGSRCVGMGGACTAAANDSSAVYYNVGALTESKRMNIEFFAITNFINLDLDLLGDWSTLEGLRKLSADQLGQWYANVDEIEHVGFSAVMPIVQTPAGENLFSFGLMASFGVQYCVRFMFVDPADPLFLEYTNYPNKLNMIFAGGFNLSGMADRFFDLDIPGISVGVGLDGFFDGQGGMNIEPSQSARFNMEMPLDQAPVAGALIKPFEDFDNDILKSIKLGVSYSQTMSMQFALGLNLTEAISGDSNGYDLFHVGQWGLGLGLNPMKKLNVGLAATRYAWSDYTPPYMESDLLGGVPIEVEKFKDIWVPRVGVEYDLLSFLKLRGGYFFRPSAVPDQVHATTVIDLDTHALSVGAGLKISDSISAGIHGQYRMLVERTMVKEGGASSVTASGNVWNLGLTLSFYED